MKTLSLEIDLSGLELADTIKKLSNQELVSRVIVNIIQSYADQVDSRTGQKRGLNYTENRIFTKLGDAFEQVEKDKLNTIELEDAWYELIEKCVKESKMMPDKLLNRVFDLIEQVGKE